MKAYLSLLSIIILINISSCSEPNPKSTPSNIELQPTWYNVAFLITDGVYNTELTAPYDIFHHTKFRDNIQPMNVFTVSNQSGFVTTFEGLKILPDYNFNTDTIPPIDILVVPSAEHHLDTDLENKNLINWISKIGKKAQFVTSHCDGSFMLAKAGLLDSVASTTFPSDIKLFRKMFPKLDVRDSIYFVHDGKFITSAGGAKSFEAALYLTEILYGTEIAQEIADGLVIEWNLNAIPHMIISKSTDDN